MAWNEFCDWLIENTMSYVSLSDMRNLESYIEYGGVMFFKDHTVTFENKTWKDVSYEKMKEIVKKMI